ncbi:MAG: bifunctional UDP-N-acetylglucosamine diphosphorylase/glucosamine-1-phosphate N-acetyltransferase GlmU, partial [Candidatus Dormibacteraeota bacterium]|nr:bifunctional UDP-N-acetylglucosamine diphosphorylase/glucosamine-1-phosphate N-acetyltransferase GlmU [Candidatus Dormibacteraeota bacterium]
ARTVVQEQPRGTGDALAAVPSDLIRDKDLLIVHGDQPLLRPQTLAALVAAHHESKAVATIASTHAPGRPDGRILRDESGRFLRIVEHRDATPAERAIEEINVGAYCVRGASVGPALARLRPDNAQGELYLTDLFPLLAGVQVFPIGDPEEATGINDRVELARAAAVLRRRRLEDLMRRGVTVVDPASTLVEQDVEIGEDTVLEPGTLIRGRTTVGRGCHLGPFTEIIDARLGDGVTVTHSWVNGARIGDGSDCGPFAKLRPGTDIGPGVHVGSFAELVRTRVGTGSAVPHVSYLGDTTVGERVNVAAGTITANYDGTKKNPTRIGDDVFLGVDTMLVAPVEVGRSARTGAGSVVTRDVPEGATVVGMPARRIRRAQIADRSGGTPEEGHDRQGPDGGGIRE